MVRDKFTDKILTKIMRCACDSCDGCANTINEKCQIIASNRACKWYGKMCDGKYKSVTWGKKADPTEPEDTDCKFLDSGGGCELMSFRKCDDEICPRNDMEATNGK
jgi:hypothetical protein